MADDVVLELRVHGVHGTPPASMLGVDASQVAQVAGDALTGIYRIDGADPPLRQPGPAAPLPTIEAYSWGALTSGVRGWFGWVNRALWLMLLPFALVNLAYWARLETGHDSIRSRFGLATVRLSGLLLTVFATLTPCVVAIDLFGWQCFRADQSVCSVLPDVSDRLATLAAGERLALTALVPLAILGLVVFLSFQSLARYEATRAEVPTAMVQSDEPDPDASVLAHPRMWRGRHRTTWLQRLHIVAAICTVMCFTGLHVMRTVSGRAWGAAGLVCVTTWASVLVLAVALVLVTVVHPDDLESTVVDADRRHRRGRRAGLARTLVTAAVVIAVAHLVLLWRTPFTALQEQADYAGSNVWFMAIFVAVTVLHLAAFVGGRMSGRWAGAVLAALVAILASGWWWVARTEFDPTDPVDVVVPAVVATGVWLALLVWHRGVSARFASRAWGGAGSSMMLAAAAMVALLFSSATVVASADYLNGNTDSVRDLTTHHGAGHVDEGAVPTYRLSGDLELRRPTIVRDDAGSRLVRGTLLVDGLERATADGDGRLEPTTYVRRAVLVLPENVRQVLFRRGCVNADGSDCRDRVDGVLRAEPCDEGWCLPLEGRGSGVKIEVRDDPPQAQLVVPQVLIWAPIAVTVAVVAAVALVVVAVMVFRRTAAPDVRSAAHGDGRVPQEDRYPVADRRVDAALAHRSERILDIVGSAISLILLWMIALAAGGHPPWDVRPGLGAVADGALYVVLGVSVLLIYVGSQVRTSVSVRRAVGVLWDISTFWPRAAHPFAPPSYAERVVPEVMTRVGWALDRPAGGAVVLSGHSQGSLICLAVVCRLAGVEDRLRLVTYGSQIRALYGRTFPRAAGPEAIGSVPTRGPARLTEAPPVAIGPAGPLDRLCGRMAARGHWVNLVRRADPLGFRVFDDVDSPLDRVTLEVPVRDVGDPHPTVMTHGGYQHSPEYRWLMAQWTGEAFVGVPGTVADVPPLPAP